MGGWGPRILGVECLRKWRVRMRWTEGGAVVGGVPHPRDLSCWDKS